MGTMICGVSLLFVVCLRAVLTTTVVDIYLSFMDPEYQNTSAWSDMITWGLEQADEAEKRVFVQASASEKAGYEKLGFQMKTVVPLSEGDRYLMLRRA